jgi:hypothetical protein
MERPEWEGPQLAIRVWNTSDQPIFLPMLIGNPRHVGPGKLFALESTGVLETHLRPGHESEAHVPIGREHRVPDAVSSKNPPCHDCRCFRLSVIHFSGAVLCHASS